jgi:hypothetical protein
MVSEELKRIQITPEQLGQMSPSLFFFGETPKAWKAYSYREMFFWGPNGRTIPGVERWQGQDIKGKRLLLTYEQTLGEQIMFSAMIPELLARGIDITFEVDERLVPLMQQSFPTITVIPWSSPWHPEVYKADYHCLAGNPALYVRQERHIYANAGSWLKAEPLDLGVNKPIGVSWWSPHTVRGLYKTVDLRHFEPLLEDKNITCVNLQYGVEPEYPMYKVPGVDLVQDIVGIARVIQGCDAIVTISNTVAHLAGALGKKTFLLLDEGLRHHWYWEMGWYNSITKCEKILISESWDQKIKEIHKKVIDLYT